jgi:hypothetical protein
VSLAALGGCVSKGDIQRVQDDIALFKAETARRDSARAAQLAELIQVQQRIMDSLTSSRKTVAQLRGGLLGSGLSTAGDGECRGSQEHQQRWCAHQDSNHGLGATVVRPRRRDHEGSRAAPGVASCRTRPVSISTIQIWRRPLRSEMKATCRLSGAQVGSSLRPDEVSCRMRRAPTSTRNI